MEAIRILHVVTKMDAAGLETLLMNIYRNIDRNKIQFDFLTHRSTEGFYDKEIKELGGHIYHVPPINPLKHNEYLSALDGFFWNKRHEYKIVHSHINTFSMYPLRAAQKVGIPIRIAHSHIANVPLGLKTPFRLYAKWKLKKYTTYNFACSIEAGKYLFGTKAIVLDNFKVVNNAIDSKRYIYSKEIEKKIKKQLDLDNSFILGHIGRFTKQKNHTFLIEIFKEVYKNNPSARLVLVGEGELEDEIKQQVVKNDLEKVVLFLGVKDNISELIQAFDVFVLPSLFEGLGIVAIEAQAAGIPCLVSEAVPNEAYLTDIIYSQSLKDDANKWSNAVLKLKNKKKINTSMQILSSGYDIKEESKKLQSFYEKVYES